MLVQYINIYENKNAYIIEEMLLRYHMMVNKRKVGHIERFPQGYFRLVFRKSHFTYVVENLLYLIGKGYCKKK